MRDYSDEMESPDPEIGPFGDQYEDLLWKLKQKKQDINDPMNFLPYYDFDLANSTNKR